ncbi:hypothetical protein BWQ96_06642 [Gracilariopsis chorda]|uniref:Uncharacterized protein n=1 Tax=Gracilariopsis chorda TaxID=448386 RepID=A0A2V3INK2_9FLOR|nr:hypothetical protein BWQ96_06642 [Gracilariopsis chorda]|eukprot:PXF43633.1 hypothetical protein BWQ96_06642 [Gracilariopsis chorda]
MDRIVEVTLFHPVPELQEEIKSDMIKGKNYKAPGEDGITSDILQIDLKDSGGFSSRSGELWAAQNMCL